MVEVKIACRLGDLMERLQPFLLYNLSLLEVTYTVPCMFKLKPRTRFGGFKVPRMSLASVGPFGRQDWRRSALSPIEARSRQVKLVLEPTNRSYTRFFFW